MADPENMKKDKIKTIDGPIVNVHGSLDEAPLDGIVEFQKLVISTRSLPYEAWKKTRIYASIAELLYFNKVFQIPLMVLNTIEKISFRELFEHFSNEVSNLKVIKNINQNLKRHAEKIAEGKSEFIYKEGFLDIYWPPGEFEYIKLVINKDLTNFYEEMTSHYLRLCKNDENKEIFKESVVLNQAIMRSPFSNKDEFLNLNFNIFENYQEILKLNKPDFYKTKNKIKIIRSDMSFKTNQDWMREVIWYGHRSGKYMCNVENFNNDEAVRKDNTATQVLS